MAEMIEDVDFPQLIKVYDGDWFKDDWLDGEIHVVSPDLSKTSIAPSHVCNFFKLIAGHRGYMLKTTVIGGFIHIQQNGPIVQRKNDDKD